MVRINVSIDSLDNKKIAVALADHGVNRIVKPRLVMHSTSLGQRGVAKWRG
jgi:hypothetical protein